MCLLPWTRCLTKKKKKKIAENYTKISCIKWWIWGSYWYGKTVASILISSRLFARTVASVTVTITEVVAVYGFYLTVLSTARVLIVMSSNVPPKQEVLTHQQP